jgi:hypothetical protein
MSCLVYSPLKFHRPFLFEHTSWKKKKT